MVPLARRIIRYTSLNREAVCVFVGVLLFSVLVGTVAFSYFERTVAINDNGKIALAKTMKYTVGEVLNQKGIFVGPQDELNVVSKDKLLKKIRNDIYIKRAVPITVFTDGVENTVFTTKDTVYEALSNSKLDFNVFDRVLGVSMTDKICSGMKLDLVRVTSKNVSEKEKLSFETQKRESRELADGEEKVVRPGVEGIRETNYKVLFEDGKEIAKQFLNQCVITAPIDRIVEFGDKYSHRTSRGGVVRFSRVLNVRTTAYTASYADTGKAPGHPQFGITFTGVRAKRGIVAVDPRVIPLGSRMYIELAGDTPDYGYAVAGDTGGAIKNDLVDLYFDTSKEVDRWGCRRGKVYILE